MSLEQLSNEELGALRADLERKTAEAEREIQRRWSLYQADLEERKRRFRKELESIPEPVFPASSPWLAPARTNLPTGGFIINANGVGPIARAVAGSAGFPGGASE